MTIARSVLLLLLATTLWGSSSAIVAGINTAVSAPIVAASAGVVLLIFSAVRGQHIWARLRMEPLFYLKIGALEAMNLLLYFIALNIGPTPVVVALHLSAPVLVIVHQVIVHQRTLDLLVCIEIGLVVGAILLVVSDPIEYASAWCMFLACALALGSSVAVAVLVTLIAAESQHRPAAGSAGLQLSVAAAMCTPLLIVGSWPDRFDVLLLIGAGAILLGPGFVLYWIALKRLDASTASVLGLSEAVVASALVGVFRVGDITVATTIAGVLVLLSVGLESFGGPRRVGD